MKPKLNPNKTTLFHGTDSRGPAVGAATQARPEKLGSEEPAYDVLTFDCYGTLIDWEKGIRESFQQELRQRGQTKVSSDRLVTLYDEEERRVEKEKPYKSYREVQSQAVQAVARSGWNIRDPNILSESLPKWKPFPDTNPALERLAEHYTLGILSNVDNDLLATTLTHFTVPFQLVITAEEVESYKPSPAHFKAARKIIGAKRWLHAAGSLYHDIEPATKLGIPAVWVNRNSAKPGPSATNRTAKEVGNLTELADWLHA